MASLPHTRQKKDPRNAPRLVKVRKVSGTNPYDGERPSEKCVEPILPKSLAGYI
jgi:hypothetical protein